MSTPDPLQQLAAIRPTPALLEHEWPAGRRTALLEQVQATPARSDATDLVTTRAPRRRRWVAAAALAGAAAAGLLAAGLTLPSGSPGGASGAAAASLERLAGRAEAAPADGIEPGQFSHLIDHSDQNGDVVVHESWTSYDGRIWRRDTDNGHATYWRFPAGGHGVNDASPAFLAGLPTDPAALESYLRAHISGSTSTDEAVFTAVGDLLRGGLAPADLRAAAIRVLEHTGHVTAASTHDTLGRPAIKITFTDEANRPGEQQALLFDPNTSAILEESIVAPDLTFTATYSGTSTVDAVPADVLSKAVDPETVPKYCTGNCPTPNR